MKSPSFRGVTRGRLDRPLKRGIHLLHAGRSPEALMNLWGLRSSFVSSMSSLEILPHLNFLLPRPIEKRNLVDGSERHSRNLQRIDIHGLVLRDHKLHVPAGFLGS